MFVILPSPSGQGGIDEPIRKSIYRSIGHSQFKPVQTEEQKNRKISNRESIGHKQPQCPMPHFLGFSVRLFFGFTVHRSLAIQALEKIYTQFD
jgi:hypothetical protein